MTQPAEPEAQQEEFPVAETSLAAFEVAIAAAVLAAYTAWLRLVERAVLAAFHLFGAAPDPTAVWSTVPAWTREMETLLNSLESLARKGWEEAAAALGQQVPFDPEDPIVQDTLQRTRNLMVRTPDDVYRRVIDALADAAGGGHQEQVAAVRHVLDVTGTENWPARAQTVAVTEVHRAYNMGAYAAGLRIAQDTNRRILKRWVSKDDSAVRPGHRLADGQIQFMEQPFIVAGEALYAPGDPSGSPWNVINCRCKMRISYGRQQ